MAIMSGFCLYRVMNHMPLKRLLTENDAQSGASAGTHKSVRYNITLSLYVFTIWRES